MGQHMIEHSLSLREGFSSDFKTRDVDYFDEDSMVHYGFGDAQVIGSDASMAVGLRYYLDYSIFTAYNLLAGPVNIILDHTFLISVALLTRFIHLIIDVGPFPKRLVLKDVITCILGIYLLETYLERVAGDSLDSSRAVIYTTLVTFAMLDKLRQGDEEHNSRNDHKKSNLDSTPIKYGCSIIIFAPILINEYYIHLRRKQQHSYLRGILMTLSMKAVSQIYAKTHNKSNGFLSNLTHLLHPASCISGLWHEKIDTATHTGSLKSEFFKISVQVYRFLMTFFRAFLVLIISVNISDLIYLIDSAVSASKLTLLSEVYLIAQEFRFSHYFSCLLFKSLFNIWEDPKVREEGKLEACEIKNVEWPRSLLQVVTSWNIPMHIWLKDYVFRPIRQKTNTAAAIFATYLISSLLHGFKFHIWAVLLTLGFITWAEYHLRLKLATRFSACILVRECRLTLDGKCTKGHGNTAHNSSITRLFNSIFRAVAMLELAYLGYIFIGNTDEANYRDVIRLWSELSFFGHFFAGGTFIVSFFVRS